MSGRPWLIAVTVDGVNLPRFLRRAGEMGLLLTDVRIRGKHLSAFAREDDVPPLYYETPEAKYKLHTLSCPCSYTAYIQFFQPCLHFYHIN